MGIVIIILLVIVLGLGLVLLFKIFKWVFHKKGRVVWMFTLLAGMVVGISINNLFFVKMEFIRSQVYPNLFLIKNPVDDTAILHQSIKKKVLQYTAAEGVTPKEWDTLRFYEYSKGDWGESGTAYFIKNKERRDGMTAELLGYYKRLLIAEYHQQACDIKGSGHLGKLKYYNDYEQIKTDTLLNSCK